MTKPIALTLGDPSGIGPEIAAEAWRQLGDDIPLVLLGDADVMASENVPVSIGTARAGALHVEPIPLAVPRQPGKAQPQNASATIAAIEAAVDMTKAGTARAVVTNPINKKVLKDGAGFAFPGHTEFLAALDGRARSVMMLACSELKIVPVTIHIPLGDVVNALTDALLEETIRITHEAMQRDFSMSAPRIAVAGLNPHAGEGGVMGREEITLITPVLDRLRAEGMLITGPMSADTMFHTAARAHYDVAVAMYHDQALIPVKTLGFDEGVNATLGLSFIRTSPDHGTAFDIAGKGVADASSLIAAIRMADAMAEQRGV